VTTPIYDLGLLPPGKMELDIVGTSIESGRSQSGITGAIDFSGGGLWTCRYSQIYVFGSQQHLYYQYLRNYLRGGVRSIIVPFLNDFVAPTPIVAGPISTPVRFSDTTTFSDTSTFSQDAIAAVMVGNAAANATTITIQVQVGGALRGGETFSINHFSPKWQRAYGISELDSFTAPDSNGAVNYTVAITPPLRAAVADGTSLEFSRPECVMRLMAGGSGMPWTVEKYWQGVFDLQFIESFLPT
jgi:hypothetical protein